MTDYWYGFTCGCIWMLVIVAAFRAAYWAGTREGKS